MTQSDPPPVSLSEARENERIELYWADIYKTVNAANVGTLQAKWIFHLTGAKDLEEPGEFVGARDDVGRWDHGGEEAGVVGHVRGDVGGHAQCAVDRRHLTPLTVFRFEATDVSRFLERRHGQRSRRR